MIIDRARAPTIVETNIPIALTSVLRLQNFYLQDSIRPQRLELPAVIDANVFPAIFSNPPSRHMGDPLGYMARAIAIFNSAPLRGRNQCVPQNGRQMVVFFIGIVRPRSVATNGHICSAVALLHGGPGNPREPLDQVFFACGCTSACRAPRGPLARLSDHSERRREKQ